jgi:hypothetical protein
LDGSGPANGRGAAAQAATDNANNMAIKFFMNPFQSIDVQAD